MKKKDDVEGAESNEKYVEGGYCNAMSTQKLKMIPYSNALLPQSYLVIVVPLRLLHSLSPNDFIVYFSVPRLNEMDSPRYYNINSKMFPVLFWNE